MKLILTGARPTAALREHLHVAVIALVAAAMSIAGARMMFNSLMRYDDEGYVLLSLRSFAEHGALYRDVYSQYGPLPYVLYWLLHLAGMPLVHTTGRLVTLCLWCGAAVAPASLVWRWTRSLAAALATLTGVYLYLWLSVREPTHPGSLVALLVAITATVGSRFLMEGRTSAWAIVTGLCTAALLLTKINTGVFAGISSATFAATYAAFPRVRRMSPWLLMAGLAALPHVLMHSHYSSPWVATLGVLFSLSAITVVGTARAAAIQAETITCSHRAVVLACLAGIAVLAGVLGLVMSRGTSFAEFEDGILLGPLRHPIHFGLQMPPPAAVIAAGGVSLAAFIGAHWAHRRLTASVQTLIAISRLAILVIAAGSLAAFPRIYPHTVVFWWLVPWTWVLIWPLGDEAPARIAGKTWLALVGLGQWLHAYPVPGTQIPWGSFLFLPLVAIAAWDAATWLVARFDRISTLHLRRPVHLALFAMAVTSLWRIVAAGSDYPHDKPLALRGSDGIRVPASQAAMYQILCANAERHADMLFTLPGMFSFNLWTGIAPPTRANVTQWFLLLDETRQREIIAKLEEAARPCVIVDTLHVQVLRTEGLAPSGPLYRYIVAEFTCAFRIGDFEFWTKKGRNILPFFTAEVLTLPAETPVRGAPNTLLKIPVALGADAEIGSIELAAMANGPANPRVLTNASARFELLSVSSEGEVTGQPAPVGLPFRVRSPAVILIYFNQRNVVFSAAETMLTLRAPDGAELAVVRLKS